MMIEAKGFEERESKNRSCGRGHGRKVEKRGNILPVGRKLEEATDLKKYLLDVLEPTFHYFVSK